MIGVVVAIVVCGAAAQAQDELIKRIEPVRSYDGIVDFQKSPQAARMFDFNYPAKDLDKALETYLVGRGGKIRSVKGYSVVQGVLLHEAESKVYDVYYKVEGKGGGSRAMSTLTVILADPNEDILKRSQPQAGEAGVTEALPVFSGTGATAFFGDLGAVVGDYEHAQAIAAGEDELRKATKRYNDLIDEGQNLAKRKQKLEEDIAKNIDAQSKPAREVDKAKLKLEQLKAMKRG